MPSLRALTSEHDFKEVTTMNDRAKSKQSGGTGRLIPLSPYTHLRLEIKATNDQYYVDLRKYVLNNKHSVPTKQGITIPIERLKQFSLLIKQAVSEVDKYDLIEPKSNE